MLQRARSLVIGPRMNILSIQSHVAYGHAGNSAAVFPLQRIGVEVWSVHTVQFSNHSGYGAWRVQVPRPDYVRGMEFLQGVGSKTGGMPLSNELMYVD